MKRIHLYRPSDNGTYCGVRDIAATSSWSNFIAHEGRCRSCERNVMAWPELEHSIDVDLHKRDVAMRKANP